MNGVLVVDKPAGPTSHDVVARVRRAIETRRIGHTGTLDPLATGVLPLVVGAATRLASLLSGADKEYVAGIRLGLATATYDATGLAEAPPSPAAVEMSDVGAALERFRGTFMQMPPPFSAKKVDGMRAYRLARSNKPVQLSPVRVTVRDLAVESYETGLVRVRVRASAGFYVRSLAHDLGQALGCGAYLDTLRRTRSGSFGEDAAVPLDTIEREGVEAVRRLWPLESLLPEMPAVVLNDRGLRRAMHGNELGRADVRDGNSAVGTDGHTARCRLLDESGTLIAIAERNTEGLLHPVIVLV
jgi:tRNA pseudouridine55 synthase